MNVFSQAFAYKLSQEYLGFASFRKYDFAGFSKLSQGFARFRKVSQMDFRKKARKLGNHRW